VVGVDEVVCARVPESEHVHGLVWRSRALAERMLLTTGSGRDRLSDSQVRLTHMNVSIGLEQGEQRQ
jgi:hypothetical protein